MTTKIKLVTDVLNYCIIKPQLEAKVKIKLHNQKNKKDRSTA
jgi:hypothetical protein